MFQRNIAILFACQLIAVGASVVMVTLGGVIGSTLAGDPRLATLPVSLTVLGTALATIPATMIMQRIGRRLGFFGAAMLASLATALAAAALVQSSFGVFCVATGMFGMSIAFVQQYRFAAAESVAAPLVGRAIGVVLLGSIGGALIGPYIATHGRDAILAAPYVGSMLWLSALLLAAALLLLALVTPAASVAQAGVRPPRALSVIAAQPRFLVAVGAAVVGYSVMAFVMTATPLSMHVVDGYSIEATASVIRSHVIAMYAPSLVSAYLIERMGLLRMMTLGAALFTLTIAAGLLGQQLMHYYVALIALGVGWNFLYIGGTTLLTRTYTRNERFKAQAVNDFSVFGMCAIGSLLAGTIMQSYGWSVLIAVTIPPLLIVLLALAYMQVRERRRATG